MTMLQDVRLSERFSPLWYRVPVWVVLTVVSVTQTHGVAARVATGVLMGVGSLLLQASRHPNVWFRRFTVIAATGLGLAACFTAPSGLAEVLVAVTASRAPDAFDGAALGTFTVVDAVGFGVTLGLITDSVPALAAGLAIPFLVQRSLEHKELVRERDRAQALLAEAQRGRESEAQAAALQERGRIAREMHDVLAHSLAGLSVQLQGVRAVAAREQVSPAVLDPLDKAATLAREGLAEARAAVGALRDPVGLGVGELPALIDRHPGETTLTVDGDIGRVTPEAGHAVYRSVQEALTNAARYAPGSPVRVALAWSPAALVVTIADTGPAPGREPVRGQGTGLGLAGMTERIQQAGGTLTAGLGPGGGWRIELQVPATNEHSEVAT